MLFESRPWYGLLSNSCWEAAVLENGEVQEDLYITSRVRLVVLYNINFTTGADLQGCFIRSRPHPCLETGLVTAWHWNVAYPSLSVQRKLTMSLYFIFRSGALRGLK